ncbi:MAG: hypothetical protein WCJ30_28840, partial [Deltaproteobacteria bacterium]
MTTTDWHRTLDLAGITIEIRSAGYDAEALDQRFAAFFTDAPAEMSLVTDFAEAHLAIEQPSGASYPSPAVERCGDMLVYQRKGFRMQFDPAAGRASAS